MDAAGPIFGAQAQAQQYTSQAALATQQAKDVSLQATQTSEQRREQLNQSLANISANRAQSGLSLDSPTAVAIQGAVKNTAARTEAIQRVGSLNQRQALEWQASAARRASSNAITGGYLSTYGKIESDAAALVGA